MPSVNKKNIREMSLTSSFVAGGHVHHYHTGTLIAFFRFEGIPRYFGNPINSSGSICEPPFTTTGARKGKADSDQNTDSPNSEKIFDSAGFITGTYASIVAADSTAAVPSEVVSYSSDTPYVFHNYFPDKNRIANSNLWTSSSMQVRSIHFKSSGSNNTPRGSYEFDGSGGLIRISGSQFTKTFVKSARVGGGYTLAGWIKPDIDAGTTEYKTTRHYNRPIIRIASGNISPTLNAATPDWITFGYSVSPRKVYPSAHPRSGTSYGVLDESRHRKLYLRTLVHSQSHDTNLYYTKDECIKDNVWQHVAVVFPPLSDFEALVEARPTFYVNGKKMQTAVSSSSTTRPNAIMPWKSIDFDFKSTQHASQIGGFGDPKISGGSDNANAFIGKMDDVAIWTRALGEDDIKAIWASHRGAFPPKSGFLNNPPRVMIRENDNVAGTYPSYSRQGTFTDKPFDDERTLSATPSSARSAISFKALPPHKTKIVLEDSGGRQAPFVFFSEHLSEKPYPLGAASGSIIFRDVNHTSLDNPGIIYLEDTTGGRHYIALGEKEGEDLPGNTQALTGTLSSAQQALVPESHRTRVYSLSRETIRSPEDTTPTSGAQRGSAGIVANNLVEIINGVSEFSSNFYADNPRTFTIGSDTCYEVVIYHKKKGVLGNDKGIAINGTAIKGASNAPQLVTVNTTGQIYAQGFQGGFYPVDISAATVSPADPRVLTKVPGIGSLVEAYKGPAATITSGDRRSKTAPRISLDTKLTAIPSQTSVFEAISLADKTADLRSKDPAKFERERKTSRDPKILTARNIVASLTSAINAASEVRIKAKGDVDQIVLEQEIPGVAGNTQITVKALKTRSTQGATDGNGYVTISRLDALGMKVESDFTGGRARKTLYPYRADATKTKLIDSTHASPYARTSIEVEDDGDPRQLDVVEGYYESQKYTPFNEAESSAAFGICSVLSSPVDTSPKRPVVTNRRSRIYGTDVDSDGMFMNYGSIDHIFFNEPLRSKDKIVIDVNPEVSTNLYYNGGLGQTSSYPMAYFNFQKKEWEKIGFGRSSHQGVRDKYQTDETITDDLKLDNLLGNVYAGFGNGHDLSVLLSNPKHKSASDAYKLMARASKPLKEGLITLTRREGSLVFGDSGFMSPTDAFGFPYHPKYHATGSQTLNVSSLVDKPFLVEKIVYEFSGSSDFKVPAQIFEKGIEPRQHYSTTGGTFFILNQRKSANTTKNQDDFYAKVRVAAEAGVDRTNMQDYDARSSTPQYHIWNSGSQIPARKILAPNGPKVYVETIRDLVTFARVGVVQENYDDLVNNLQPWSTHPARFMDLAVEVNKGHQLSGEFTLSAPVKAPTRNEMPQVWHTKYISGSSPDGNRAIFLGRTSATRNGLDTITGRSMGGEFYATEITHQTVGSHGNVLQDSGNQHLGPAGSSTADRRSNLVLSNHGQEDSADSPYIIMPGDELILGWQAPLTSGSNIQGRNLRLHPGKGKITLYGSYVKDDKPFHNPFKQPLNTDSIHEQIPASPAVFDRFETEPSMLYSGSYIARHITGSMKWPFPDINQSDKAMTEWDLAFARRVVHRDQGPVDVDEGASLNRINRRRFSMLRGVKLIDREEQYYDSMQPHPSKLLTINTPQLFKLGDGALLFVSEPNAKGKEGQYDTILPPISNYDFIGSYPFEPKYSGINRVRKITARIMKEVELPISNLNDPEPVGRRPFTSIIIGAYNVNSSSFAENKNLTGSLISTSSLAHSQGFWTSWNPHDSPDFNKLPQGLGVAIHPDFDTEISPGPTVEMMSRDSESIAGYNPLLSKFLGCFGDGVFGVPQFRSIKDSPSEGYSPTNEGGLPYFRGLIYRGVKYGLINPTPLYSSAVFSHTSFGQAVDMIEPRKYSVFVNEAGDQTLPAIEVEFIDRSIIPDINGEMTNNITSGSATNSTNLSQYCTSSMPYDDSLADYGQINDRSTLLPEIILARSKAGIS